MLTSIRIKNWRSHKDTYLEFSKGTNLLVGIMGGGKSSVLEAVSFALFGTFPALERRTIRLEDVIRFGEEQAAVILTLRLNGQDYRIERTVLKKEKRVGTKAEVFRDGSLIETGSSAVTGYIEQLLGVDYDLFTRAIYSEQNNIDYFLNLDPSGRKEEMDRLLGLDRFEEARGNIVTVINRVESNRRMLEGLEDQNLVKETREELEKRSKEIQSLKEKIDSISKEYEKEASALKKNEEKFEAVREKKKEFEELERELTKIHGMIESLKLEIDPNVTEGIKEKATEELEALKAVLQEARISRQKLENEKSNSVKELGSIYEQIKAEHERRAVVEKVNETLAALGGSNLEQLKMEHATLEERMLKLSSEKKVLENEISELLELMEKIRPGMTNCPLCGSKLDEKSMGHIREEKNRLIIEKKERMKRSEEERKVVEKKIELLKTRIKKIELMLEKKEELEKERKDIAALEGRKKVLESKIKEMEEKAERDEELISEKRKNYEKLMVTCERYARILANKQKLKLYAEKEEELKNKISSLGYYEKDFDEARALLEATRIRQQKLELEKNALQQQLKMVTEMEAALRRRMEEIEKNRKTVAYLSKLSEELKMYKNALLETQINLRRNLIEAINAAMNEIWTIFYPYKNYSGIRLSVTEKSYIFEVYEHGGWKTLETVASGGERACAALTLRVALATVLTPNLSWLILDEPTHNLDKEAVALLSETLQFKVPQVVSQTFVITHDEGLMGADFASSYRFYRNKEINGPTQAERI